MTTPSIAEVEARLLRAFGPADEHPGACICWCCSALAVLRAARPLLEELRFYDECERANDDYRRGVVDDIALATLDALLAQPSQPPETK